MILNIDGEDWLVVKDCGYQDLAGGCPTYVVTPAGNKPGDPDEHRLALMHSGAFRFWFDLEIDSNGGSGPEVLAAIDRETELLIKFMGIPC